VPIKYRPLIAGPKPGWGEASFVTRLSCVRKKFAPRHEIGAGATVAWRQLTTRREFTPRTSFFKNCKSISFIFSASLAIRKENTENLSP
jgi:hypothetical protein